MRIELPQQVKKAIALLEAQGHAAHIVGGCVRDCLMGRTPKDWDICTSALPAETRVCLAVAGYPVIDTGLKHGTVTAIIEKMPLEITTYRKDGVYSDNRRPDSVCFVNSLSEDLSRRDFTINAIAYHPSEGLTDPFGGKEDIANRRLRCIGDPNKRFQEDGLRIVRLFRFASVLEFDIDPATFQGAASKRALLQNIANERIQSEFNQLLTAINPIPSLRQMIASGILFEFMPEFKAAVGFDQNNRHHAMTVDEHILCAIAHSPVDLTVRLTLLFHDLGKPSTYTVDDAGKGHFYGHAQISGHIAREIMDRLKYNNATKDIVLKLVRHHDDEIFSQYALKKMINRLGIDLTRKLIQVKRADNLAQAPQYIPQRQSQLDEAESSLEAILRQKQCLSLQDLAVDGEDIMELGFEGPIIGKILNYLLNKVLEDNDLNKKAILLQYAAAYKNNL